MFLLGDEELCVDEIAEKMKVRVSNVSQHLSVMGERGVVETRRTGITATSLLENIFV
ncbi:ArsR family transcriptional regulator [Petroclostridium sp. X23]|uniref:ArsR family transcriptional regulator n=1 Tax=Petroclostridium sp. X23 TaxID=3045146 RepID=UPI0024AE76F5|nr:ArsR family transcriptional regulator [Petroclostridium sp. X23]WHH61171.1 ArsR family transcriptional regulator [Petroclostridium sp. X23]